MDQTDYSQCVYLYITFLSKQVHLYGALAVQCQLEFALSFSD